MKKKFKLPTGKYRQDFFEQFSENKSENSNKLASIISKTEIREGNISILNNNMENEEKETILPINSIKEPIINNDPPIMENPELMSEGEQLYEGNLSDIELNKITSPSPLTDNLEKAQLEETQPLNIEKEKKTFSNQLQSIIVEEEKQIEENEENKENESNNESEIIDEFNFDSKIVSYPKWRTQATLILPKITKNKQFEIIKRKLEKDSIAYNTNKEILKLHNISIKTLIELTLLIQHKEGEDILWKSDSPIEFFNINDLNNKIIPKYNEDGELIKQNILICGLGLGILPNLLSLRNDIGKILVIEEQQEIIDLVKPYLDLDPIKIVNGDSLTYIKLLNEDKVLLSGYFPNKQIDLIIIDNWANSEEQKRKKILYFSITQFIKTYFPNTPYLILNHNDSLQNYE